MTGHVLTWRDKTRRCKSGRGIVPRLDWAGKDKISRDGAWQDKESYVAERDETGVGSAGLGLTRQGIVQDAT